MFTACLCKDFLERGDFSCFANASLYNPITKLGLEDNTACEYPDAVACIMANGYSGSLVSDIYNTNYDTWKAECKNDNACIDRLKKTTLSCYAQDHNFKVKCSNVPECPASASGAV